MSRLHRAGAAKIRSGRNCAAAETGLQLESTVRGTRDSHFRYEVVSAWGHRCAFCGFGVRLDNADLGLEAAHIRWCQFGDRGALTLSEDHRILVSSRLNGDVGLEHLFLALHGTGLRNPALKSALPRKEFLDWHRSQVFRGEPRDLT